MMAPSRSLGCSPPLFVSEAGSVRVGTNFFHNWGRLALTFAPASEDCGLCRAMAWGLSLVPSVGLYATGDEGASACSDL